MVIREVYSSVRWVSGEVILFMFWLDTYLIERYVEVLGNAALPAHLLLFTLHGAGCSVH